MYEFPCPVCESSRYTVRYPDTLRSRVPSFDYDFTRNGSLTYRIVECKACSHQYASPRPADIWKYYNSGIEDPIYLQQSDQRFATGRKVIQQIVKYRRSGRLLDVGCSTGDFLAVARGYFDVEGAELSKWAVKIAEERGFRIHNKILSEIDLSDHFDIVTMWGVIEHFEFPKQEVANISRLLRGHGLVCLWTGDVNSTLASLLGKRWWNFQGQHIQMFTKRSLSKLFTDNGYRQLYVGRYPYVFTVNSLSNSLTRYPSISKIARPILNSKLFSDLKFSLRLPGELFAIYEKI